MDYPPTWRSAPADPYGGGHMRFAYSQREEKQVDEKKKELAEVMIEDPIAYFMDFYEKQRKEAK